jgi:ElaB/YqjD/DUF883 family membrane-anchored ribosome-binding protein
MINRLRNGAVKSRSAESADARTPSASDATSAGLWSRVHDVVKDNPKTSLAAALAAGVLLGWIMKRR